MELCHAVLNTPIATPRLDHWSLPNGVRIVEAEMPDAPLTCLDLWCQAGSSSEQRQEQGMAHFLEHMVFKGSQDLPAGAFDREIEALGGSSNAATGFDDVHFHVMIPPEQAPRALELLLELVLHPALADEDFEMEREVVLEEIAQYADQPDERVIQELLTRGCPKHAYGRPILGFRDDLIAMNPDAMKRFHRRLYQGHRCCLAVAGPIQPALRQRIESSALTDLPSATDHDTSTGLVHQSGRHEVSVPRLESARFLMLWPMAAAKQLPLVMGADLVTSLLGEGRRSRMVDQLREQLKIAETVDVDLTVLEQGSLATLEVCCPENALTAVEEAVHEQLHRLESDPVESWEFDRALRLVGNGLRFALESSGQVASMAASQTLWGREQSLLEPLQHLENWTLEALRSSLFPQLQPEKACTLIARPGGRG